MQVLQKLYSLVLPLVLPGGKRPLKVPDWIDQRFPVDSIALLLHQREEIRPLLRARHIQVIEHVVQKRRD